MFLCQLCSFKRHSAVRTLHYSLPPNTTLYIFSKDVYIEVYLSELRTCKSWTEREMISEWVEMRVTWSQSEVRYDESEMIWDWVKMRVRRSESELRWGSSDLTVSEDESELGRGWDDLRASEDESGIIQGRDDLAWFAMKAWFSQLHFSVWGTSPTKISL